MSQRKSGLDNRGPEGHSESGGFYSLCDGKPWDNSKHGVIECDLHSVEMW